MLLGQVLNFLRCLEERGEFLLPKLLPGTQRRTFHFRYTPPRRSVIITEQFHGEANYKSSLEINFLSSSHPLKQSSMTINSETIDEISSSVCHNVLKYSTSVPDGPESCEDLKNVVEKGVPDMPRCGFSSLAVRVLKVYDVPFGARNILENPELKNAVKSVSNWQTFPQIFIEGEFIGGSDIILNMHQTGELKEKL